jgi:hypothetical protein
LIYRTGYNGARWDAKPTHISLPSGNPVDHPVIQIHGFETRGFQNCDGQRLVAKKSVKDVGPIHKLVFPGQENTVFS